MRIVKQGLTSLALPHLPIIERSHDVTAPMLVRSFSNDNGDGDENVITAIGLLSKTASLHVYYAFLYISLPAVTARLRLENT